MSARDGAPRTVVRFVRHDVLPHAYGFELGCLNWAARDFPSTAATRHGAPGHPRPQGGVSGIALPVRGNRISASSELGLYPPPCGEGRRLKRVTRVFDALWRRGGGRAVVR